MGLCSSVMRAPSLTAVAAIVIAAALALAPSAPARAQAKSPTVVELFTSQGCNSCPPADAYLGELAQRDDVLALSMHIDYWDYLGWTDSFAIPHATERQRAYGRALGKTYVYTPQMVINGAAEAMGSRRPGVERAIERAAAERRGSVSVSLTASADDDRLLIRIAGGEPRDAVVWLVLYDRRHEVEVGHGENGGRKLIYHNVVRDITRIGTWTGKPLEIALAADALRQGGRSACAVLVQENGHGAIIGAARMALDGG